MALLKPTPPPYDPLTWVKLPLAERARAVCTSWALQGYGAPLGVYGFYLVKLALYVGGWLFVCSQSPELGAPEDIAEWWLHPLAFERAIVWSLFFEVLGLGCGSGPLTARYLPPFGGALYWLRPGTLKVPLFPKAPWVGRDVRGWFEVTLYLALLAQLCSVLLSESPERVDYALIVLLLVSLGVLDKAIFLAARAEHYGVTVLILALTDDFVAGAMAVQLALWFWAGVSKLNHHFPAVVCVMTSNNPFLRIPALRKRMYRQYPEDLRPSSLATVIAHFGTALELGIPLVLLAWQGPTGLWVGLVMMLLLHGFITSNVPMGVPIEWNIMVAYGGFALFYAHPDTMVWSMQSWAVIGVVSLSCVVVPLLGNLIPERVSFLLAMRYYAGNWPYGVWLFRGDSYRKLERLKMTSAWVPDQLSRFYDTATVIGLVGTVMGFRMMHLQGRVLGEALPRALEGPMRDYEYVDGEVLAGMVLGWNFGDGLLHREDLLRSIQARCDFEPGELRCVFVESQPLFGRDIRWRVVDAAEGRLAEGRAEVSKLRERQPFEVCADQRASSTSSQARR